jgi:hypothetical protein
MSLPLVSVTPGNWNTWVTLIPAPDSGVVGLWQSNNPPSVYPLYKITWHSANTPSITVETLDVNTGEMIQSTSSGRPWSTVAQQQCIAFDLCGNVLTAILYSGGGSETWATFSPGGGTTAPPPSTIPFIAGAPGLCGVTNSQQNACNGQAVCNGHACAFAYDRGKYKGPRQQLPCSGECTPITDSGHGRVNLSLGKSSQSNAIVQQQPNVVSYNDNIRGPKSCVCSWCQLQLTNDKCTTSRCNTHKSTACLVSTPATSTVTRTAIKQLCCTNIQFGRPACARNGPCSKRG